MAKITSANPNVSLTLISHNSKTGPIPVAVSSAQTCPSTCPWRDKGCYANYGPAQLHWREVTNGNRGTDWETFCQQIKQLPPNQLWRMNVSGDLPRYSDGTIHSVKLDQLVGSNYGKRGFTYTHHKLSPKNVAYLKQANLGGFTINVSADTVERADQVMTDHGLPAVAIVESRYSDKTVTPSFFKTETGRLVVVCPASRNDNINCANCGLCADSTRDYVIAFPAHGAAHKHVNNTVKNA